MFSLLRSALAGGRRCYTPIIPFHLADIGEGIKEVEVIQWHVKEGQEVKQFDKIAEVQSDKATVEITSRYDGRIAKLHYAKGQMAQVGDPLVDIDVVGEVKGGGVSVPQVADKQNSVDDAIEEAEGKRDSGLESATVKAMPSVRLLAKRMGVDLGLVKATGHHGQVTRADVMAMAAEKPQTSGTPLPAERASKIVQLTGFQRAMVKRMEAALKIPHFGYCDQWSMERLQAIRQDLAEAFAAKHGLKLTLLPFVIKAASLALREYPQLNGWYEGGNSIEYRGEHNLSLAIDTPHGLAVPNIKGVESKTITQIAKELALLTERARSNNLSREQIEGGTFCLSNIGSLGGVWASPIIMAPQLMIGALGRTQQDGLMPVSWAADHRVVDGATVAKFSACMRDLLRQPGELLLWL